MVMLGLFSKMYIKFQFLGSVALYMRFENVLGGYNLACLFLFDALTQIINIVMFG